MGKKLFQLFKDPAARPSDAKQARGGAAVAIPADEAAAPTQSRMRELIKREFTEDQVAVLRELTQTGEGAAKYTDTPVMMQDVVDTGTDMLKIISQESGLRMVSMRDYPRADMKLRSMLDAEQAKALKVVPVEEKPDGTIVVAIADPSNPTISDDLRLIMGREVETVIAPEEEIKERLDTYYGMSGETIEDLIEKEEDVVDDGAGTSSVSQQAFDLTDPELLANSAPIIKLVNLLLLRAIEDRASDIHIEPFPTFIRIRYRVDGVLREMPSPPRSQLVAITSRVKVMANMNISESRRPQDGRLKLNVEGREIDMRVSSMPTVHGEAIVMRVLDKSMMMIGISQIGMMGEVLDRFKRLIRLPNGILLVTGPTGSGKTTSLYAALAEVRDPGEKLITTEDPVEYEMDGIQQVNINENVGLTFARCLRAILRQDPDKVLVGEIRDVETAQIAVQAALTGHLVFSTLHTNSASATVTRLLDMGVEPFLITSAVEGVIGQRLVRTVCQSCRAEYKPTEEDLMDFGKTMADVREENLTFFAGRGCAECGHSGYHGRLGIFELLEFTDEVRELVLERATTDEIHELAVRQGMITMREDGWEKAKLGITTLGEISRQTPSEMGPAPKSKTILTGERPAAEEPEEDRELPRPPDALPSPEATARKSMVPEEEATVIERKH